MTIATWPDGMRRCTMCGCSDDDGCSVGCQWVKDEICSACVDAYAHIHRFASAAYGGVMAGRHSSEILQLMGRNDIDALDLIRARVPLEIVDLVFKCVALHPPRPRRMYVPVPADAVSCDL